MVELDARTLDLTGIVRSGDMVFWGHGTSEPLVLSEALMRQRVALGRFGVFLGPTFSTTPQPIHADHVDFLSYCGIGANQALHAAGALDILPCHLSQLPSLLAEGVLRCDVALLQLSASNGCGSFSLGVSNDYMLDAAARARVVVAEVNDAAPWTHGSEALAGLRIDYVVRTSRPVLELPQHPPTSVESAVASRVAALIPDRAVLQMGIGTVPRAIFSALRGHRDLGLHSGMVGDGVIDLIESGVITNAAKSIDRGVSVTGMLAGSQKLYRFAHQRRELCLQSVHYTHAAEVLGQLEHFCAVNSAIEVDLTGQVNAELIGASYVGAVGGQADFMRAAVRSPGGRGIIALPSTASGGSRSRVVARLGAGVITTSRSDADVFVTEWGVAELRGQSLAERVRRMVSIAHPDFREALEREGHALIAGTTQPKGIPV